VPVLAYAATAVPATMDGGGVLYETKDPFEVARLMDAVADDARIEAGVLDSQDAALLRLLRKDFGGTLLRFVEDSLRRPPRDAPEVAWDFWQQFDQFERLEELRQFRPAVYRALPAAPGPGTRDSGLRKPPLRPKSGMRDPGSESVPRPERGGSPLRTGTSAGSRVPDPESRR
jgi:hypothetical protein